MVSHASHDLHFGLFGREHLGNGSRQPIQQQTSVLQADTAHDPSTNPGDTGPTWATTRVARTSIRAHLPNPLQKRRGPEVQDGNMRTQRRSNKNEEDPCAKKGKITLSLSP